MKKKITGGYCRDCAKRGGRTCWVFKHENKRPDDSDWYACCRPKKADKIKEAEEKIANEQIRLAKEEKDRGDAIEREKQRIEDEKKRTEELEKAIKEAWQIFD